MTSIEKRISYIYKDANDMEIDQGFGLVNKIASELDELYNAYEKQLENERREKE